MKNRIPFEVEGLTVTTTFGDELVADVKLRLEPGHILGLLGESGAGKTVSAKALLGLLPPGLKATGKVRFDETGWLGLDEPERIATRLGRSAGMMLQNPVGSFDPLQRVGPQLIEAVVRARVMTKGEARERAAGLCDYLGLGDPDRLFRLYPHELSGGMAQRTALALTLMPSPRFLVVDEPTSALDANLRVDALRLLRSIAGETGTAMVLVSHDLGLVSRFCDSIAVLYAGHVVESGSTADVLDDTSHPYTKTLLACSLKLDRPGRMPLPTLGGEPPQPGEWPSGCHFHPRCPDSQELCRIESPKFVTEAAHGAACHFAR
ncbi:ABC transporter ATP-binding protein [Saccharomonospora sp. NPDC006951]